MIPTYAPYDPASVPQTPLAPLASEDHEASTVHGDVSLSTANASVGQPVSPAAMPTIDVWRRVSRSTVLLTLNQLAVMSQNGIEIAEALEIVASQCRNPRLGESLREIHQAVNGGQTFSGAVAAYGWYFPDTLSPMLAAAEATGEVPDTLGKVCERMRSELTLRGTILGAMIYPLILIIAASVVMSALIFGVLPQFSKVFMSLGRPIPSTTQLLLDLGDFCRAHWVWIVLSVFGSLTAMWFVRNHPMIRRPINRFLMYGPLIRSAYRPLQAGRTFRTLAAMVGGGVPLLQAVRLARRTTKDFYWRMLLDRMEEELIDGANASCAMVGIDFIPPEAGQMMSTAERTGRLAEVLESIGEFYEAEAGRQIKRLVVTLEPAIILAMGVMVAGVVMSLLLPLLDVTSVR